MVTASKADFQHLIWAYFEASGRHDLPWRRPEATGQFDPYRVMVSELMLQQTQVPRVIPKYSEFLRLFPSLAALAKAELGEVLKAWSGLGYNRRAKYLWQAAQAIDAKFGGVFPQTTAELISLPGIGKNTAGAILAYAFNQPVLFIETNVRTVYIHHFFANQTDISDAAIAALVEQTLDTSNPREWYWALMDYGSYLKTSTGNASKHSQTYTKQSAFHGSRRQLRGQVLKQLTQGATSFDGLQFAIDDDRLASVLADLLAEALIRQNNDSYSL